MKRLAVIVLFACNTTSTTPPMPAPTASSQKAPPPSATTSAASPSSTCTKDADCSLMSSYCSDLPCACVPYLTSAGAPKCNQPNAVKCLVDPCQRKAPGCQEGKCVVTAGATQ